MYRAVTPRRGWLRILWDRGKQHKHSVADHIERVREIPGCRLLHSGAAFDIPHTAWRLEPVRELLAACCVVAPQTTPMPALWAAAEHLLYPFQQAAVARILGKESRAQDKPGFLLADDMGLGKTRVAIAAAQGLRLSSPWKRPGLIIAPLFTRGVWRHELAAMGVLGDFLALEGRDVGAGLPTPPPDWCFVHYDVVEAWSGQFKARASESPIVAIVDEAHWVKNSRSKRGRGTAVAALGTRYRILLTGTPMENRPAELWHLLTVACGERSWGSYGEFRRRYCGAISDSYGLQDQGPTHVEELRERMAPFYLRRTAQDVALELPSLTRTLYPIGRERLDEEHDFILHSTAAKMILQSLRDGLMGDGVLAVISRMRQATSRAKLAATRSILASALEQGESIVAFTWERATAAKLAAGLPNACVATGEQSQDERDAIVAAFQASEQPMALIATLGSLREGVTLHRARTVVMHDLHWVLAHMLQAEKRIHRIGQTRACQVIWMIVEDSIDALLAKVLVDKAHVADEVLGIRDGALAVEQLSLDVMAPIEEQLSAALRAWEAA